MQTPVPAPPATPDPAPEPQTWRPNPWPLVLLLLFWGGGGYLYIASRPPASEPPQRESGVVRESNEVTSSGGRGPSYVELEIFTGERLIEVQARSALIPLGETPQPGDSVVVWTTRRGRRRRVWQMEVNGRQVFSYAQTRRLLDDRRRLAKGLSLVILGTAVLGALVGVTQRSRKQASPTPPPSASH